jgi:membrane peptidoglycan carboxypeptidase
MVNNNEPPERRSLRPASSQGAQKRPGSIPPRSGQQRTTSGQQRTTSGQQRTTSGRHAVAQPPRWRFWLRRIGVGALVAGIAVGLIGAIGLLLRYVSLETPPPSAFALEQASTIYYADGVTPIGELGEADRTIIDIDTLPQHVPDAFVAAEDRSFYTNAGVDFGGTARAMFKTIVLGQKQGGSTISQQYVERYYVGETTTNVVGKIDEALLALKINRQQDKDEILGNYMNTIYFGRGAYGIEAAAQAYYGKGAAELTPSEVALLAGILPAPSRWDPRFNEEQARFRWNYVLDGMEELGTITANERSLMLFPATIEYQNLDVYGGPEGYLLRSILNEIESTTGLTQ